MSTLINPEIVINLDDILHSTIVKYTDSTCSLHEALQDHCRNLMLYNHPDPKCIDPEYWKTLFYNALETVPKLRIHTWGSNDVLKMDLLLELCVQYIFDRSLDRTIKRNYHMVTWDNSRYRWTRDFRFG